MPEVTKPQRKRPASPKLSRVRENINILAVSVALAVAVWVFAKTSETEEAGLTIPVVVTPEDPRIELRVSPTQMPVIIRYPKELRNAITSENFYFSVDISDLVDQLGLDWVVKTEPMTEKNLVAQIRGSRRVTLVRAGAGKNTVRVEARWKAQPAAVVPDIVGMDRLPPGYQLQTPVRVDPPEVWLTGRPEVLLSLPRDPVTSRIKVLTERIDVSGRTQGAIVTVPIRTPLGAEIISPRTTTADVTLDIQEIQTVKEIRGVKISLSAVAPDAVKLEYNEKTATVTVFGPQSLLPKVTPEMIEVSFVRPPEEIPGTTHNVVLEARFANSAPEEIRSRLTIRSIQPSSIKVRYVPTQESANKPSP